MSNQNIAKVIVPIPVDTPFSYAIPEELADLIQPGVQVIVPFGERYKSGIVLKAGLTTDDPEYEIKPVYDVVDPVPFIGEDLVKLLEWISNYYICHLGEAYRLINPSVNLHKSKYEIRKLEKNIPNDLSPAMAAFLAQITPREWTSLKKIENALQSSNVLYRVHLLKKRRLIETRYTPPKVKKVYKTIDFFKLRPQDQWSDTAKTKYLNGQSKRYARALELIGHIRDNGSASRPDLKEARFSAGLIKRLLEEQVLECWEEEIFRSQESPFQEANKSIQLTEAQQDFTEKVLPFIKEKPAHKTFLLHGITGSGKTQVYIELIRQVLVQKKQAIVLIPEIVLTPQTMARFKNYFGEEVAVIHSRVSPGEKTEVLQKAREGKISIMIGPRSAVFAPFKNLGIIIVDEEHEASYKQNDATPRYNARDVALYRAYLNNIPIVLGSATPTLESLYNGKTEKYEYYHLSERISHRNLPRTQLVDLKEEWRKSGAPQLFSENLLLKMESRLISKEQAMLLQNRRGFSPYIQCQECGYVEKCPNCDITLTYHFKGKNLRCHYCGHSDQAPDFCPQCRGIDILYKGVGTQKIEEEMKERFPHGRLLRMDQDTTKRKDDHAKMLEKFRNYEADFLIGTKMIAKGLDFEQVTLVGVVNADQGLHFPDFRASEKTFQLLVQAAGRAGRGAYSGEVVIQTFDPNHYIFKYLTTHDYLKFYARELTTRETLNYPPFARVCLIRIVGDSEERVAFYGGEIAKFLWRNNTEKKFQVLGPAPAPMVKINNQYRYQILIKQLRKVDPAMTYLRRLLKKGVYQNPDIKKWPVKVQIDVDPLEIL